jgi:WS/DGAT/MGAT family acyltransferase
MDRLSPLDAAFIEAEDEDRHTSMAIGSVAVFEGPAPSYSEFMTAIEQRLPLVPRYRQKLRTLPLHLGPPVWVDDPRFDLTYHIRETAVPGPGGDAELARLMARVMAQRLDRDRPLWEDWLVTGLAGGHWALISKVHHCMVDGVSGTDLYRVMFDEIAALGIPPTFPLRPEPGTVELVTRAVADNLSLPVRTAGAVAALTRHPVSALRHTQATMRAAWKAAPSVPPAPRSSLNGPIGEHRRYTWARVALAEVKNVRHELGGTVNDVVLAAIASGFRALLLSRGEVPAVHMVPSLVPVSLRAPGTENVYENQVSGMIVNLPVHLADPVEQLAAVRREISELKASDEPRVGQAITNVAGYLLYGPWAALVRLGFRLPQREIVTVTTNVPGPRQTLYCLGRPLVEILPYVPIASRVRIGVAIFSYRDTIAFGITGDYDSAPDLDILARGIEDGVTALVKAAHRP